MASASNSTATAAAKAHEGVDWARLARAASQQDDMEPLQRLLRSKYDDGNDFWWTSVGRSFLRQNALIAAFAGKEAPTLYLCRDRHVPIFVVPPDERRHLEATAPERHSRILECAIAGKHEGLALASARPGVDVSRA